MPEKLDSYSSYGQKLISLFAKLLFTRRSYSLTELKESLRCSKQTILRLVDNIRRSYGVEVEEFMDGNRKYFQIRRPAGEPPPPSLTDMEMSTLFMCRAFAEHLLGRDLFVETTRALDKGYALLPQDNTSSFDHFASFKPGSIDYTPHQTSIRTIIEAMDKKRICRITYKSTMAGTAKTFDIKPLKIFSHRDTIYLHARLARKPSKPYAEPDYDPLLAIHRIVGVEFTEKQFEYPGDYNFEKVFNENFGIIKDEAFQVEVEFSGFAAHYVAERTWSPNQQIRPIDDAKIVLTFDTASVPEVISWLLSFGEEAKLLSPDWLVKQVKKKLIKMKKFYHNI